jgi:hypothetical protein
MAWMPGLRKAVSVRAAIVMILREASLSRLATANHHQAKEY